eukprot:789234-Rhodomonas_salina.3
MSFCPRSRCVSMLQCETAAAILVTPSSASSLPERFKRPSALYVSNASARRSAPLVCNLLPLRERSESALHCPSTLDSRPAASGPILFSPRSSSVSDSHWPRTLQSRWIPFEPRSLRNILSIRRPVNSASTSHSFAIPSGPSWLPLRSSSTSLCPKPLPTELNMPSSMDIEGVWSISVHLMRSLLWTRRSKLREM